MSCIDENWISLRYSFPLHIPWLSLLELGVIEPIENNKKLYLTASYHPEMVGPGYIMCDYMDAMMLKFKFLHLQVLFFQRHELYDMCSVGSKMAL